jgi:paraquat-inducible protein A
MQPPEDQPSVSSNASGDSLDQYVACPHCDLLYRVRPLPPHHMARCFRCGTALYRGGRMQLEVVLAWTLTASILLLVSNSYPILAISAAGRAGEVTFLQAVRHFMGQDMWLLALVVFLTSILVPVFRISSLALVLWLAWTRHARLGGLRHLLRWDTLMAPWGMLEIYLLGLLVAFVKLRDLAAVVPGIAFYAFCLLILSLGMLATLLDRFQLWRLFDRVTPGAKR